MRTRRSWIALPLLVLPLTGAWAQESLSAGQALVAEPKGSLLDETAPDPVTGELALVRETRAWNRLYLNRSGLEVRRPLEIGDREIELGLKGPLMKRKRLGLAFEVKF